MPAGRVAVVRRDAPVGEPVAEPDVLAGAPHDVPAQPDKPFLREHRWLILGVLIVIAALGTLAVRWWFGPQVSNEPRVES